MADLILVLDGSRLVEVCTHDDQEGSLLRAVQYPSRFVSIALVAGRESVVSQPARPRNGFSA